jgi:hypothetical protein
MPIKNVEEGIDAKSAFIADGYAIEYQRRQQRYTDNGEFDDSHFFICVGKTTDTNNTITYNVPGQGMVTRPNHLFIGEQGVDNAVGINDDALNYRIAPANIIDRWIRYLSIGMWTKPSAQFDFAKGEVNFTAGGDNLSNHIDCEIQKKFFENEPNDVVCAPIFPETVKLELPITALQFQILRANPYGLILVNGIPFYLDSLNFKVSANSTITLIKAKIC